MRWRGVDLDLLDHPYNDTALNERAVEVPLALHWLRGRAGPGLEVGNVLGHYPGAPAERRVVDLYEQAPGVDNLDVLDVDGSYAWVVAISTVEHVRWSPPDGELDPSGSMLAVAHLRSLVRPGGGLLVTVPFAQQPHLDRTILETGLDADREATLQLTVDGWVAHEGERMWRPLRECCWPTCVWVGEWGP